ncbi:MAG: exodeoxyribonuclease VII small subunit [Lachnospiraceae bacterium]|nr:exodeoxyribonuclease VII small subunit [Lachnospiraceae bacterium]
MAARKKQENVEEKQQKEQTLEESFAELDAVMEELEKGDISLEASFALYQRGMQLVKQCNASIDRVEKQLIALEEEGIG